MWVPLSGCSQSSSGEPTSARRCLTSPIPAPKPGCRWVDSRQRTSRGCCSCSPVLCRSAASPRCPQPGQRAQAVSPGGAELRPACAVRSSKAASSALPAVGEGEGSHTSCTRWPCHRWRPGRLDTDTAKLQLALLDSKRRRPGGGYVSSDSEDGAGEELPAGPVFAETCTVGGPGFAGGSANAAVTFRLQARDARGTQIREGECLQPGLDVPYPCAATPDLCCAQVAAT